MNSDLSYSFSLTTFSPSGKLGQITHALNAVQSAPTAIGIRATDGVVIATEKKTGTILIDPSSVKKVMRISDTIGAVYAGIGADYRVLVHKGRKLAETYRTTYGEGEPVMVLVKELAEVAQEYTQSGGVRPFGCSLLVAGLSHAARPELYQVDPSGSYYEWKATSIGKDASTARAFLEKRYSDEMDLEDALHTALQTLKETFDGQLSAAQCEVGVVGGEYGPRFRLLARDEVEDVLRELE